MAPRALAVFAGREAARRLAEGGWKPELFSLLMGASGGPKWFVLSQLDRLLFGDFLQRGTAPLSVIGSSIGSWRHVCLTAADPAAAVARLEQLYIRQRYSERPTPAEVSAAGLKTLELLLQEDGERRLLQHPRITTHLVTARARGPAGSDSGPLLATGLGLAALGNAVSRRLLQAHFQRVVFHSGAAPDPGLHLDDFNTAFCPLAPDNLRAALHASGSIPFVLTGERDIPGAPPGQYWDGGIVDYHFDPRQYAGEGMILYPHFSAAVVPGWFDKFLPWRRVDVGELERLVLLCPTPEFVASLPHGKIPDRRDFTRFGDDDREAYWQACVDRGLVLAEEFAALIAARDPLQGVTVLEPQ